MENMSESMGPNGAGPARLTRDNTGVVGEIWAYMRVRKKFWLAPIIVVLLLLGFLLWVGGAGGVLSPFIYAM